MMTISLYTSRFNQASRFGPPRSCQICPNAVWRVSCERERSDPERSKAERYVAKPETAAYRTKLDSDKFGDDAGDQIGGLIEPWNQIKFSITHFMDDLLTCPL